ncbi:MAG: phosphotriesterase family protein, partial [Acidimicrobiia bacterium]
MTVRTVLGDVDAGSLGVTYVHEHLILDNRLIAADYPHIHLPSVDEAVAELEPCAAAGVGCMVDAMPAAGGRHPDRLAAISQRTGVAIVAMTGLHTPKYYIHHPWAVEADPDVLAQLFVADIEVGIDRFDYTGPIVDRTKHRAGIIKVATEIAKVSDRAHRV